MPIAAALFMVSCETEQDQPWANAVVNTPETPSPTPIATSLCVDSDLAGAAADAIATVGRIQPALGEAHRTVGDAFEAAGDKPWGPYVEIQPALGCPDGTPRLIVPSDGRPLRDVPVRGPVQAAGQFQLLLFVVRDSDAAALFPGKDHLRIVYEQICNEKGGSCREVSTALFVSESTASSDAAIFDAITDGLGFRQYLKYPTGHAPSEDGVTK